MNFNFESSKKSSRDFNKPRLHNEISLFDLHCDTLYEGYKSLSSTGDFNLASSSYHIDLNRGLEYSKWVQIFASWIPDKIRGEAAFRLCADSLNVAKNAEQNLSAKFEIVKNYSDISRINAEGKCAAILSIESGAALVGRLENLDYFSKLGVKLITITWSGENELGYGCNFDKFDKSEMKSEKRLGLKPFGFDALRRMEQLSIIPDVSHLNEAGFWDVLECTSNAVVATHSNSHFVFPHVRNLRDEQFLAIKNRGGIVGLNLCQSHLGVEREERANSSEILPLFFAHLEHFLSLGGENMLALGLDLDGTDLPADWDGIQNVYEIYNFLLRKNYQETLVSKLFFDNSYDFFTNLT